MNVYMCLSEETNDELNQRRKELSMTKEQYLKLLLSNKDIRPEVVLFEGEIEKIAEIEKELRVLCLNDSLSEIEKLKVFEYLSYLRNVMKNTFGHNVQKLRERK